MPLAPSPYSPLMFLISHTSISLNMGNCLTLSSSNQSKALPIDTIFKFPSPIPTWPPGEGFASGTIDLGGLKVKQITTFTKIWSTHEEGLGGLGATFFEPSPIPDGFSMLGCYCQPNNQPLFGWVLVGKDDTTEQSEKALKQPIDYTLVWSSESSKNAKDGQGYIWLPTPPDGYKAVGHVVTTSPTKPPLDKIWCVRSDLTDQCRTDKWIWGEDTEFNSDKFNVFKLKPSNIGKQALGVSVGTFLAQKSGSTSTPIDIACLKNNKFDSSTMPNLTQIEAIVQAYSPLIYFHPKDPYLPSSVTWYFNNGVQLHTKESDGSSKSEPIDPTGSNLPQGGSTDGAYWLDLPADESAKERVKKGDLQSSEAYVHIKPMLGATFTDLAIWVFYPFNGPGTAKFGLIDISMGKLGEHIGDWEHLTLRVSNFNGVLYSVYFSQHSKGTWIDSTSLEFEIGNKPVAYSSLNGHAFYAKQGLVLQGTAGIGIKNETEKSEKVMDIGKRYQIVSGENVVEPPWLNYARKWGPEITYKIGVELEKVENLLPGDLKAVFKRLVDVLPDEVFGEEGPTGPKVKNSWNGDEP